MKITILVPKNEFNMSQQKQLALLGEIVYVSSRKKQLFGKLVKLARGTKILGADPDVFGGFEVAKKELTKLMDQLPNLKAVTLSTTSFSWVDLNYCKKRKIVVTNVPYYSTESVAEHILTLLFCLAKNVIINDREAQKKKGNWLKTGPGFELKGKTLGVIGLGHIGSRVADLGKAVGMKVIVWNRTSKKKKGVQMKTLNEVLAESDAISINLIDNKETHHFISAKEIKKMKNSVVVVNLAARQIIDEKAMAKALKKGQVVAYGYEGEDLDSGPLAKINNAIGLQSFAWYTKEALERASEIWTKSIVATVKGRPINVVS